MASRCVVKLPHPPCAALQHGRASSRVPARPTQSAASRERVVACAVSFRPCIDIHKVSGLQVGGGINLENAMSYLNEGASHVIVTSYVFSDGKMNIERLTQLVELVGKRRLILDLSCRKKIVASLCESFSAHINLPKDKWFKYHPPIEVNVVKSNPVEEKVIAYNDPIVPFRKVHEEATSLPGATYPL
ncbi:hypothetical protein ZWY2020_035673, partial [Hordeum vulgare]